MGDSPFLEKDIGNFDNYRSSVFDEDRNFAETYSWVE